LPSCNAVGFILRTWTLTDIAGNTTIAIQTIWVQPVPRISVEVPDTLFCNGSTVNFTIDSLVISSGEVMYNLDVTYPVAVTGTLTDGSHQIIDISDLLTNNSDSHQTVTYRFSPYIQGKPGDPTCSNGIDTTIVIHLEPTAKVSHTLANDELCNGDNVLINLATVTNPFIGLEFNIDAIPTHPDISGFTDRSGLIVTDVITEPLTNSGDTARLVRYIISPVTLDLNGNQKCFGINDTVEVWVNPTPRVIPVNITPETCYGAPVNITLTSPTVMTSGVIRFDYTITETAPPPIVAGNRVGAVDVMPGTVLTFAYTNESDTLQSIFFNITPKVNFGVPCANGITVPAEVKIHARPLQNVIIKDSITCDGGSNGSLEAFPSKGAGPYMYYWTGPLGWTAQGIDLRIAENLIDGVYTTEVVDNLGCRNQVVDIELNEPNTDVVFYTSKLITCPGSHDAEFTLAMTEGDAPPFDFEILFNSTDLIASGTLTGLYMPVFIDSIGPGEYLLKITDANGCILARIINVYDPPPVVAQFDKSNFSGYNVTCAGYSDGSLRVSQITGRGAFTYQWSATGGGVIPAGMENDSILTGIPAGTYNLEVRDRMNCPFYFTEPITEPDGIDLLDTVYSWSPDHQFNISCFGRNDGSIDLTFDGGAGAYTYTWTGPPGATLVQNVEDQTGLIAGNYHLLVRDGNNCVRNYDFPLSEPDSVGIDVIKSWTPDNAYNISCNGEDGLINITVTGGSGPGTYGYLWKDTGNPAWQSTLEDQSIKAGVYRVYVTDANGCTTDRGVELTQPMPLELALTVSEITCLTAPVYNDGAIDLAVAGGRPVYTFNWSNGATSEDISALTSGNYSVTVTDDYGCISVIDTTLNLPEPLLVSVIRPSNRNGFDISCLGMSDGWLKVIPTTGLAPYTYEWRDQGGNIIGVTDSVGGLIESTYSVTVTDAHLCEAIESVTLHSPGQIGMNIVPLPSNGGGYNINCAGDASGRVNITPVNAAGPATYTWSDAGTGSARNDLRAGITYTVTIRDSNGCQAEGSVLLTEPDSLKITFTSVAPFCPESTDASITANVTGGEGIYSYEWSDGQTTQEASGLTAGRYRVTVTDFNGCAIADSLKIEPVNRICVGIPNAITPDGDGRNDDWNIGRIDLYPEAEVVIMNRWGEVVWISEKGYPVRWDGRAKNGNLLPIDSYHYVIDLKNGEKPIVGHVTIIR
jgi:gliding motility-associated-like protein